MAAKSRGATSRAAKKGQSRRARTGRGATNPIDDALARLERDIPRILRQLRGNVREMQKQVDRARADGEQRWREAERRIKRDAGVLRDRLERAIGRMKGSVGASKKRGAARGGRSAPRGKRSSRSGSAGRRAR